MRKPLRLALTAVAAALLLILGAAIAAEAFCYFFPIRRINRPGLNRWFETPEFHVRVRTNSMGMRHRRDIPQQKPAGEKRIFLIGDSMIFGSTLQRRDAVPAQLQAMLNPEGGKQYRVINTSASATGPLHYSQRLRALAIPFQADLALVFFYVGNDMQDTWNPYWVFPYSLKNYCKRFMPNTYLWLTKWRNNRPLPRQGEQPQKVSYDDWNQNKLRYWGKTEGVTPDEADARAMSLSRTARTWLGQKVIDPSRIYTALLHPQELNDISTLGTSGLRVSMQRCKKILRSMHGLASKAGLPLALVIVPSSEQVHAEQWEFLRALGFDVNPGMVLQDKPQQELTAFCKAENILCLDLLPWLRQAPAQPLYQAHNSMWTPQAAAYVAGILRDFIREKKLLTAAAKQPIRA